jgi:FkbM family methyltransferase
MSGPVESAEQGHGDAGPQRVRLDYPNCDIWIYATSRMEEQWRARSCAKEPWTVSWIETHIASGDVLYDIGANVGTFSLLAARHRGASVVAFEPGYANFARLCENIQLNGCHRSIIPLPFPVAEASGLVGFKYRTLDPGQSRHGLRQETWRPKGGAPGAKYEQPVCAMQLDEAIARFHLPPPAHIKIDVDGAEGRVLAGARRVLRSPHLKTALIEIDPAQWESVLGTLTDARFQLAAQYGHRKPDAPYYGLFVRPEKPLRRRWTLWK